MNTCKMRDQKTRKPGSRLSGLICIAGGLVFLLNYAALNMIGPLDLLIEPAAAALVKSVFRCVVSLCLVGGLCALLALNASETGWRNALGVIGATITILSVVSYIIGSIYVVIFVAEYCANFLRHTIHPY